MKIEIKLHDTNYCNGCPCRRQKQNWQIQCLQGYGDDLPIEQMPDNKDRYRTIRPEQCRKDNGD